MIVFAELLTYEQPEGVFRERGIVRKLHHRNSPTRRGGNRCQIVEAESEGLTLHHGFHISHREKQF